MRPESSPEVAHARPRCIDDNRCGHSVGLRGLLGVWWRHSQGREGKGGGEGLGGSLGVKWGGGWLSVAMAGLGRRTTAKMQATASRPQIPTRPPVPPPCPTLFSPPSPTLSPALSASQHAYLQAQTRGPHRAHPRAPPSREE